MVKIRAAERISILGGHKKEGQICAGVVYMQGKMLPPPRGEPNILLYPANKWRKLVQTPGFVS